MSLAPIRPPKTDLSVRVKAKLKRDRLRALGLCINGPKPENPRKLPFHGPVIRGGKCQPCIETHKITCDQSKERRDAAV